MGDRDRRAVASRLDLPEPDGPITATISPRAARRSRPRRAATGPPGDGWIRIRPTASIASAIAALRARARQARARCRISGPIAPPFTKRSPTVRPAGEPGDEPDDKDQERGDDRERLGDRDARSQWRDGCPPGVEGERRRDERPRAPRPRTSPGEAVPPTASQLVRARTCQRSMEGATPCASRSASSPRSSRRSVTAPSSRPPTDRASPISAAARSAHRIDWLSGSPSRRRSDRSRAGSRRNGTVESERRAAPRPAVRRIRDPDPHLGRAAGARDRASRGRPGMDRAGRRRTGAPAQRRSGLDRRSPTTRSGMRAVRADMEGERAVRRRRSPRDPG